MTKASTALHHTSPPTPSPPPNSPLPSRSPPLPSAPGSRATSPPQGFSLDHYLPWSFVAHDQLWNLIPTLPEVNSAKSNKIPAPLITLAANQGFLTDWRDGSQVGLATTAEGVSRSRCALQAPGCLDKKCPNGEEVGGKDS